MFFKRKYNMIEVGDTLPFLLTKNNKKTKEQFHSYVGVNKLADLAHDWDYYNWILEFKLDTVFVYIRSYLEHNKLVIRLDNNLVIDLYIKSNKLYIEKNKYEQEELIINTVKIILNELFNLDSLVDIKINKEKTNFLYKLQKVVNKT